MSWRMQAHSKHRSDALPLHSLWWSMVMITFPCKIPLPPLGHSIAQVSLKWLMHQRTVDSVVIGARTMAQLEDNCQAGLGDWKLTESQVSVVQLHVYRLCRVRVRVRLQCDCVTEWQVAHKCKYRV
eukprot:TRINITY_DN11115_c0_g3_i1.p1 TRINITY_DN11115_c0_g3~~TRINITY_DN11115_c0_g3_i1.p1  ORF type:complete len:126 (+),score=12.40 TRINITY_DN11115_c0_g3_i1:241-618(+)